MKPSSVDQPSARPLVTSWRDARVQLLLAIGVGGFAARLLIAILSAGTNDIFRWEMFAQKIAEYGLLYEYQNDPNFNHPPLMGWYASGMLALSDMLDVRFAPIFKLPMIAADAVSGGLLWLVAQRRRGALAAGGVFALYGLSPISILISAHHGNTDSLCAMFVLLAAVLAQETRWPFAAGLALGAAVNVKLIPVLCAPALLVSGPRTVRAWLQFTGGMTIGAIPFVPVLLAVGPEFYRNAIAYNSNYDHWGVMHVFRLWTTHPRLQELGVSGATLYRQLGRYVVLGSIAAVCAASWRTRHANGYLLSALALSIFLVFAPGFGVQYLIYVCPLLFVVSPWFGFAYSSIAGVFAGLVYLCYWNGQVPWVTFFTSVFPPPSHPFGVLAWATLAGFMILGVVDVFSERPRLDVP
jgi:hypothetical protein